MLIAVSTVATAQDWPSKPVKIVVPFPPGGSVDQVSRVLAQHLTPALGQQVIVDNRPGAAGSIGTAIAAKSPPDGSTFVAVFDTHAANPSLIKDLGYDAKNDLAPVMLIGTSPMVLTAHASEPYKSLGDVIAAAKANPESIGFGTIGSGSLGHLATTLLQNEGKFKLTHVPYKGGGPLAQDAIAGHVPLAMATTFVLSPHIQSKALRPLAVTGRDACRNIPTSPPSPIGFPGFRGLCVVGHPRPGEDAAADPRADARRGGEGAADPRSPRAPDPARHGHRRLLACRVRPVPRPGDGALGQGDPRQQHQRGRVTAGP